MSLPKTGFFERYPLAAPVLAWLTGIVAGKYVPGPIIFWLATLSVLWIILAGVFYLKKLHTRIALFYGALLFMFSAGICTQKINNPETKAAHLNKELPETPVRIRFIVQKTLKPTAYYRRYQAQALETDNLKIPYGLLIKIPRKLPLELMPGTIYSYLPNPGEWKDFPPPNLPFAFNYQQYAHSQGIFRTINLKDTLSLAVESKRINYYSLVATLHHKIKAFWQNHGLNPRYTAVASALLLGERQHLDSGIKQQFIDAGIMHVLAISGLHIGILLLFFRFVLQPLKSIKILYDILIVTALWTYAAFTGFSPSVLRAVMMFSFLQVSYSPERKFSGFYTLLLATFFMTIIKPQYIFEAGFQMSFLAVASILWFYPLLRQLYYPKQTVARYLLDTIYVSLAAQAGVLPPVLYYFHRFSPVFLWANLLVIPLLTLIVFTGITSIMGALFNFSIPFLVPALNFLLDILLKTTNKLAQSQSIVYKHIPLTTLQFWALILFITGWAYFLSRRNTKALIPALSLTALAIWLDNLDLYNRLKTKAVYFTQNQRKPVFILQNGLNINIYAESESIAQSVVENFLEKTRAKYVKIHHLPYAFTYGNHTFLLADSSYNPAMLNLHPNSLILHGKVKTHLALLLKKLEPGQVILSGSRPLWLDKKWKTDLEKSNISYWDFQDSGFVKFPIRQ